MNRLASPEPITFLITLPSARVRQETEHVMPSSSCSNESSGLATFHERVHQAWPANRLTSATTPSAAPSPRGRVPTVVAIFRATIRLPALEIAWPRPNSASPPHATIGLAWLELQDVA